MARTGTVGGHSGVHIQFHVRAAQYACLKALPAPRRPRGPWPAGRIVDKYGPYDSRERKADRHGAHTHPRHKANPNEDNASDISIAAIESQQIVRLPMSAILSRPQNNGALRSPLSVLPLDITRELTVTLISSMHSVLTRERGLTENTCRILHFSASSPQRPYRPTSIGDTILVV
jgi:hypothetical protein